MNYRIKEFFRYVLWVFGIVIIIIDTIQFIEHGDYLSVIFLGILFGTILLCCILINPLKNLILKNIFGNFENLDLETVRSYYTKFFDLMGILFSVFIVGLAILWGLKSGTGWSAIDYNRLHIQTILLIIFLVYTLIVLQYAIGQLLKEEIEKKCKEEKNNKIFIKNDIRKIRISIAKISKKNLQK